MSSVATDSMAKPPRHYLGQGEVLTAPGTGGGPDIRRWNGLTGAAIDNFIAFDPLLTGGYFVAGT